MNRDVLAHGVSDLLFRQQAGRETPLLLWTTVGFHHFGAQGLFSLLLQPLGLGLGLRRHLGGSAFRVLSALDLSLQRFQPRRYLRPQRHVAGVAPEIEHGQVSHRLLHIEGVPFPDDQCVVGLRHPLVLFLLPEFFQQLRQDFFLCLPRTFPLCKGTQNLQHRLRRNLGELRIVRPGEASCIGEFVHERHDVAGEVQPSVSVRPTFEHVALGESVPLGLTQGGRVNQRGDVSKL